MHRSTRVRGAREQYSGFVASRARKFRRSFGTTGKNDGAITRFVAFFHRSPRYRIDDVGFTPEFLRIH
jgi:hypothetical protein